MTPEEEAAILDAALTRDALAHAMQAARFLESPVPAAAWRWIDTFIEAFAHECPTVREALPIVADLRAEAVIVPAIDLEKLRNRQVVFFLDAVSQYVDDQRELRGLPVSRDIHEIAKEFGLKPDESHWCVHVALTGKSTGCPFELLFPLLGHDRIMMRVGAISSHLLHGRGLEPIPYGPGGVPFKTIEGTKPT
jgi:hypothetical protein